MQLAPIALFMYRRPAHLAATIKALQACDGFEQSRVLVFADGPKHTGDEDAVASARAVARSLLGDDAEFIESSRNKGLARSIIDGVTSTVDRFGRVIVLEDDLIVASDFLRFMNAGLDRYANEPRVMQISGHMFRLRDVVLRPICFLPITTSWGWATWQRAWRHFDDDLSDAPSALNDYAVRYRFNVAGTCDNSGMIKKQMRGAIDSWAITWCWNVFRSNGLVLYPTATKVINGGFDAEATHGFRTVDLRVMNQDANVAQAEYEWPAEIATDEACFDAFKEAFRVAHRSVPARLKLLRSRLFF
jgi:hypothetical protein